MDIEAMLDRIETGMTTVEDAMAVSRLVGRVMRYELVLRDIAVHGDAGAAMRACQALADVGSMPVAAGVRKECE